MEEGGWHAAEALVLARYFMFTQVYFHKTRVAYDVHMRKAMKELLPGGCLPRPEGTELNDYLKWDDWKVLGLIAEGRAGEHGRRILERDHYREIHHTHEVCTAEDRQKLDEVKSKLGELLVAEETAKTRWYKTGNPDILVVSEFGTPRVQPLSEYSMAIKGMKENDQVILYVDRASRPEAEKLLGKEN